MKRQNAEVESLVYAYGAGEPVEGWPHALDELADGPDHEPEDAGIPQPIEEGQ